MAIKQTIEYNSTNRYFAGFLQDLINESGIKASVSQGDKEIVLLIDDSDEKKLETFALYTNKYLPHSIFLGDIKTVSENMDVKSGEFKSPAYNISLCPRCLERLSDPSSQNYLDDRLKCNHYSSDEEKTFIDNTTFSPHYTDGDTLLIVDPKKINDLFIMTQDEVKALFSIEKPTIKVTVLDENLKELTKKSFINIKSAYNVRSTLVSLNAKDSEVPYLFFEDTNPFKVSVVQKNTTIVKDSFGIEKKLELLDDEADLNRFLNISKEAGFLYSSIGASLSEKHGISFMVMNELGSKKVITFAPFVLKDVFDLMSKDSVKQKMVQNFKEKFPNIIEELSLNGEYNLFETLASILELDNRAFENVSDKSLEFRGNGGVKIDTNFNDNGFDYVSFIGSIMSFKLAGTDEHYLAYSTFEALGDMVITTLNQLKQKFKIDNFIIMGSIFENTVLQSRILSKFQLSKPYFSKGFAIDD